MDLERARELREQLKARCSAITPCYSNRAYGKVDADGGIAYGPYLLNNKSGASAEEYKAAGWCPVDDTYKPDCPSGYHLMPTGKWEIAEGVCRPIYSQEMDSTVITVGKAKIAAMIDQLGKTAEFMAWLNSKAQYVTAWTDGNPTLDYDPTANGGDLASLIGALGLDAAAVSSLLDEVRE